MRMRFSRRSRVHRPALAAVLCRRSTRDLALVTGCGTSGGSGDGDPKTLVVATHDSWAMSKDVLAAFKKKTGITVKAQPQGDAGQLTNKLVLTKDSPLADGVYGIDNTFASRAVDEGVLSSYAAKAARVRRAVPAGRERQGPADPRRLQRRVRQRRRHLVRGEGRDRHRGRWPT